MITYCLGDIKAKRAAFRSMEGQNGMLSVDNDEILTTVSSEGKTYFAIGDMPFKDMGIAEYIAYSRSLINAQPVRDRETAYYAKLFGLKRPIYKKLKNLSVTDYRKVQFLAKYDLSVREIYINFDGIEYSRAHKNSILRFTGKLKKYFNIFLAVSDYRLIPKGFSLRYYDKDGGKTDIALKSYQLVKGKKRKFINILKQKKLSLGELNLHKVVVTSD